MRVVKDEAIATVMVTFGSAGVASEVEGTLMAMTLMPRAKATVTWLLPLPSLARISILSPAEINPPAAWLRGRANESIRSELPLVG